MLVIKEIRAADYIEPFMGMLRENWVETGFDFALVPDIETIDQLQAMRVLFVLGAFADDTLVGYSSAMVSGHTYNRHVKMCNSDALFVRKPWRPSSVGARLVIATEKLAAELGAVRMLWHTRAGTPFAETLQKRGYEAADIIVMKRI
jgi:GNAT superfamily N-acetyltransferase